MAGYFGETGQKATWANPQVTPEATRQNGGWYYNPATGSVDRWWNSASGPGPASTPGASAPAPASVDFSQYFKSPSLDLMGLYDQFTNSPEIQKANQDLEAKMTEINLKKKQQADAEALINDNPFYAETVVQGKVAKLRAAANQDLGVLQDEYNALANNLNTRKSEAQTKLGLATKQYDIQNQEYQNNLNKFNMLLESGALNSADSNTLASLSQATGIPLSAVQSIVAQSRQKNEVKPQLLTIDDGVNQKVVALDSQGNILHEQILGASTKKAAATGSNQGVPVQKLFDKYDTQIKSIMADADIMYQKDRKGQPDAKKSDKKLASYEVQAALSQITSLLGVDQETAAELLAKGMNSYGYSVWTP